MTPDSYIHSDIYLGSSSTNASRKLAQQSPEQALEGVARQFEALFTQQLLKSMRDSEFSDGLFDSDQTRMFQEMYDGQLASDISKKNGIGLADMLVRQLRQVYPEAKSGKAASNASGFIALPERIAVAKYSKIAQQASPKFESPQAFIDHLMPYAKSIQEKHGIDARVIVAQAALETGWGKYIIKNPDGTSSNNLFGIKADSRWSGQSAPSQTHEYIDGRKADSLERFRSYSDISEGMHDYANFILTNARYSQAVENGSDPKAYSLALQQAGYATDPEYSNKINRILSGDYFGENLSG